MKTIWKFSLGITSLQSFDLPLGAEILAVALQDGWPQMWTLVDPTAERHRRHFSLFGTGHEVPNFPGRHLATFQHDGFVWHFFEVHHVPTD